MPLLSQAAQVWDGLLPVRYQFTYGRKGQLHHIHLSFQADQFSHLSGIHYLSDIDLGRPYQKSNFLDLVLSGAIDAAAVEKSQMWGDIRGRLAALTRLEAILDEDFALYLFRREVLPFHSDLSANFLIKSLTTGELVFLFVDGPPTAAFCRSIFAYSDRDYTQNQKKAALLRKVKFQGDAQQVLLDKLTAQPPQGLRPQGGPG